MDKQKKQTEEKHQFLTYEPPCGEGEAALGSAQRSSTVHLGLSAVRARNEARS
jgi:hypothetical protein